MEKMKKYGIILLIMLAFFACQQQEEPQPLDGPLSFVVTGSFLGRDFVLEAGKNDYFMSTASNSDPYMQRWFEGRMENLEYPEDSISLTFRFRDQNPASVPEDPMSSLMPGEILSSTLDTFEFYSVQFAAQPWSINRPADSVVWDFGDGSRGSGLNVEHVYPLVDQYYTVNAEFHFQGSCVSTQQYDINPSLPGNISIELSRLPTGLYQASAIVEGFTAVSYRWDFETGISGSTSNIAFQPFDPGGIENICLEVTDALQRTYYTCLNVAYDSLSGCIGNFGHQSSKKTTISNGPLDARLLEFELWYQNRFWKGINGSGSLFILNSREFGTNRDGFITWEVEIQGSMDLYDDEGNRQNLIIEQSNIAVGTSSN